jgi:pantetheine-phosphate adenylyltransferase
MKKAIYAGSFDPITKGHIDIITRGIALFDHVVVAVATSERKAPMYELTARIAMVRACFNDSRTVSVIPLEGLLVDCAKAVDAQFLLRGLRYAQDFDYEAQQVAMNQVMAPHLDTVFLAAGEHRFISSTMVREILSLNGDVTPFVPSEIIEML